MDANGKNTNQRAYECSFCGYINKAPHVYFRHEIVCQSCCETILPQKSSNMNTHSKKNMDFVSDGGIGAIINIIHSSTSCLSCQLLDDCTLLQKANGDYYCKLAIESLLKLKSNLKL